MTKSCIVDMQWLLDNSFFMNYTKNGENIHINKTTGGNKMGDTESFTLSGQIYYFCKDEINDFSGYYDLKLVVSDKVAAGLKKRGVAVSDAKTNEQGEITIPKNSVSIKTKFQPEVVDAKKALIPEGVLVGNGSEGNVRCHFYDWSYKGKHGVGLGLDAVQITKLVEYDKKEKGSLADAFEEVDGFAISSGTVNIPEVVALNEESEFNDELPF